MYIFTVWSALNVIGQEFAKNLTKLPSVIPQGKFNFIENDHMQHRVAAFFFCTMHFSPHVSQVTSSTHSPQTTKYIGNCNQSRLTFI